MGTRGRITVEDLQTLTGQERLDALTPYEVRRSMPTETPGYAEKDMGPDPRNAGQSHVENPETNQAA